MAATEDTEEGLEAEAADEKAHDYATYKIRRQVQDRTHDGDKAALMTSREAFESRKKIRLSEECQHVSATANEYIDDPTAEYSPSTIQLAQIFEAGNYTLPNDDSTEAVKKSWSSIGFPFDESLVIDDRKPRLICPTRRS